MTSQNIFKIKLSGSHRSTIFPQRKRVICMFIDSLIQLLLIRTHFACVCVCLPAVVNCSTISQSMSLSHRTVMELIRDTSGLPEGLRVYGNAVITSVSPAGRNRERTGDEETGAVWFLGQRGDLHQPTGGPATGTTHTHCKKTKKKTLF